uniref:Expressed protein n=1 Tax=Schizophyllum commune (strain H4-8 / FGSC 9210) TaxID=578458 RepID=D8Q6X9_SCHCM
MRTVTLRPSLLGRRSGWQSRLTWTPMATSGPTMTLAALGRSRDSSLKSGGRQAFARCAGSSCPSIYRRTVIFPATGLHYYLFVSTDAFSISSSFPLLYPRYRLYNFTFHLFGLSICSPGPLPCPLLRTVSRALVLYSPHPHSVVVVVDPGLVALTGSVRKYEHILLTACLALHTVCDGCYRIRWAC